MASPQTKTDTSGVTSRWPNFFIVGAPRAGTTSLHAYLRNVPSIYLPSIKEIYFFSPFGTVKWPIPRIDAENWYRGLFADAGDRPAVGDATPTYLYDEGAAQHIHARIPDAKIIILLRDPIDRAYSHYLMAVNKGWEQRPFYQAMVETHAAPPATLFRYVYVAFGQYYQQVKRYLDLFGEQQVRIYLYEELQRDPTAVVRDVCAFLQVPLSEHFVVDTNHRFNEYRRPRNVRLGKAVRFLVDGVFMAMLLRLLKRLRGGPLTRHVLSMWDMREAMIPLYETLFFAPSPKPPMDPKAEAYLCEVYREDICQLAELLGRDLKGWLRPDGLSKGAQRH